MLKNRKNPLPNWVVKEIHSAKVAWKTRPEAWERPSHTKNRGEGIPGRKNIICKSFEVRTELGVLETERKAVKMDQSEEGESSTRWGWRGIGGRSRTDHVDQCWPREALDFILNAHKSALVDFKQNGIREPAYSLNKYLLRIQFTRVWETQWSQSLAHGG